MAEVATGEAIAGRMGADLRCPLCDYDVRGLPEPRCPECGHRFEWEEVVDPGKRRLRWFVEHGPFWRRYISTQWRLAWPRRFWREVRPSHAMSRRRAAAFCGVGFLVVLIGPLATLAFSAKQFHSQSLAFRAYYAGRPDALAAAAATNGLTPSAYLDSVAPLAGQLHFWIKVLQTSNVWAVSVPFFMQMLSLWLVLMIMPQSFSRARIKSNHLVRVVAYASDPFLSAMAVALFYLAILTAIFMAAPAPARGGPGVLTWFAVGVILLWMAIVPWLRTEAAVRNYLGFRHGWAVATASLIIAAILTAIVYTNI